MWRALASRLRQKYRTADYPESHPVLPTRFRGKPSVADVSAESAREAVACCPTGALSAGADQRLQLDMGRCLFCGKCAQTRERAVDFSRDHRLATGHRTDLVLSGNRTPSAEVRHALASRLFGRSLKLRQVSAGGCNACEADTNVLNTLTFDLGRFGIQFVASPRHADGILVTGPVTRNMELALRKTYDAIPDPKIVIAVGACAISGGIYAGGDEVLSGVGSILPVDLFIPGCPPSPWTILDGLLRFLGRPTCDTPISTPVSE